MSLWAVACTRQSSRKVGEETALPPRVLRGSPGWPSGQRERCSVVPIVLMVTKRSAKRS